MEDSLCQVSLSVGNSLHRSKLEPGETSRDLYFGPLDKETVALRQKTICNRRFTSSSYQVVLRHFKLQVASSTAS